MNHRTRTLSELQTHAACLDGRLAFAGFDGFVDTIVRAVSRRHGLGDAFTPMATISEFAERIGAASGKSTNIETFPVMHKLGGNGPIMANALLALGLKTRYAGALGKPAIHPALAEFAARTEAVSVAQPGATTALEFDDGKVMFNTTVSLDEVTFDAILAAMGEGAVAGLLARADLVALVNWTMLPAMTGIFNGLLERVLPRLPPRPARLWFFDLADPVKRSESDLVEALRTIGRFQAHGSVTLGLNLKEAQQAAAALRLPPAGGTEAALREMARAIRAALGVATVVVHPKESAACATPGGTWWVPGPYADKPVITTGGGDHFNAGFTAGQVAGLSPEACLTLGVAVSGFYVRTARSPSLNDVDAFLRGW